MKILWLSPTPSHPQDAGNRAHIFALGRQMLAAGHTVTFLLYGQEHVTQQALDEMRAFWPCFFFVPHKLRDRKKSKGSHWGIDDWFNADIENAIALLKAQDRIDAVICEYVFFSKALTFFDSSVLKILDCHDRMSGRAELLTKNGIAPDFFYTTPEEEKKALDRADLVIAIQAEEKAYFETLTAKTVLEVGYPVEANVLAYEIPVESRPLRLGYMGSNNSLNRKSLELFLAGARAEPALFDKVRIVLAGSICKSINDPAVECLGFVDKEEDFFGQIDLFINPMIDGTGLKIKTLAAIAHGTPFVATESASAGIPGTIAEHCCNSIDALLEALQTIVANPATYLPTLRQASLAVLAEYEQRQRTQMDQLRRAIGTKSLNHLRRKRVLLVTDIPFWEPGWGSHSRIQSLAQAMSHQASVDVFFLQSIWQAREAAIAASGLQATFHSYKNYEERGKAFSFSSPVNVTSLKKWRSESFGRSLKAFLASQPKYDVAIIEYIRFGYLRDAFSKDVVTVLDTHDLMAPREWRFVANGGPPPSISLTLAEELSVLDRFDGVIAIQSEEARWLQSLLKHAMTLCCPHGIEAIAGPPTIKEERQLGGAPLKLGFIGAASDANTEALLWFIAQVLPVLVHLPVELHVYGTVGTKVQGSPQGVVLHGLVPSLDAAYAECDVMINPLFCGGGIKIKSVEALAHGKPLISSPEGAVGIANPEASGVIVATNRSGFINAVIALCADVDLRLWMAHQAWQAARTQFSPQLCFSSLIELVEVA